MIGCDVYFNQSNCDYWKELKKKVRATTDLLDLEDTKKVVDEIKAHNEPVEREFDEIVDFPHLGPNYTPFHAIIDGNYPQNSKSHSSQECNVTMMAWTGARKPKVLTQKRFQIDVHGKHKHCLWLVLSLENRL